MDIILVDPVWKLVPKEARDLIDRMLAYDPAVRITAEQAFAHPWLLKSSAFFFDSLAAKELLDNLKSFSV